MRGKTTYRWHESRSLAASFAYMPFWTAASDLPAA
jgi:hypothetical protein